MSDQTRQVPVDAEHAARVISDFAEHHDVPVPTTAREVIDLLTACGFDVNLNTLAEFVRKGYISDPGEVWDATSTYCLFAALESRRRWLPTPCARDHRKTGIRIQLEQLRAAGINPPIEGLDDRSIEDLLLQMVQEQDRMARECIYEALKLKLEHFEE